MRKIQCQLIVSVSTPPTRRPIVPPPEATNANRPIAFACSRGSGNIVAIIPRITAEVMAPPIPCRKRAPISSPELVAAPQSSEAAVNTRQPGEEHRPAADQVAEAAGEQEQAAEGDQVGVDDPGEVVLAEAEVVLDRRAARR